MVFVTVGNAKQRFTRLLATIDVLASQGVFGNDTVLIQSGHNEDFRPKHCKSQPFFPMEEFEEQLKHSDLIISHGGCTLMSIVHLGKIPVAIPRRKKYGEHVNDHQMQLVEALASEGRIVPAYEPEDLPGAIEVARRRNRQPVPPPPSRMLGLVSKAIEELIGEKK
jgi:UDP-N-acetylglucosamine transferase subunit ALG13